MQVTDTNYRSIHDKTDTSPSRVHVNTAKKSELVINFDNGRKYIIEVNEGMDNASLSLQLHVLAEILMRGDGVV